MSIQFLKFINVSFAYESSANNILSNVSFHLTNGWTGIVGANGSGKSTLLKLATGDLSATSGTILLPELSEYCEQRTDFVPGHFSNLLTDYSKDSFRLIDMLNIKDEWLNRWNTLSFGERKRAQIASSLWAKPELLAIDEPTNHLDSLARELIITTLKSYKGVGLLVSHDRQLLDELCTQIIFVEDSQIFLRTGGITDATEQHLNEKQSLRDEYNKQKEEVKKLKKEINRRLQLAEKSKSQSSKKNIGRKDHDAKAKIDIGRVTGKDAVGGKLKSQLEVRLSQAVSALEKKSLAKEVKLGISVSYEQSKRNYFLKLEERKLQLGESKKLFLPELIITPENRIALTGINGSGKSTLVKSLIKNLDTAQKNILYIPQEISEEESSLVIKEIKSLSNEKLGRLLIIVSRLGSDAKRILETELPSPGEVRKLLLALGMLKEPELIIMDEPTNHLDLPSIKCLEAALKEVECALLLVSHDNYFLGKLCNINWNISNESLDQFVLKIDYD
jgi:macrolide transport system ATP-binding/permease protein